MTNNIPFPMFELYGPPCKIADCTGFLTNCMEFKTNIWFKRCSICKNEIPSKDERIIKNIIE